VGVHSLIEGVAEFRPIDTVSIGKRRILREV
jgi:hypothetical protein